jgi:proteasome lid subunit RPN8/RPN11
MPERQAMRNTTLALYALSTAVLGAALRIHTVSAPAPVSPLERALARGEVEPGVPRLDPDDPMANSARLHSLLGEVGYPAPLAYLAPEGRGRAAGSGLGACAAAPRLVSLVLDGRLSRVRFGGRAVCQLRLLKSISVRQPGFGRRGLAEVAAFVLGRRLGDAADVDVTRIVVPPFYFTESTVTFLDADLGPLERGERLIGTYHTHPEGDLEQGVLSATDLRFMRHGHVDFHGKVGYLARPNDGGDGLDWLFDIVDPRDGDWNVFAHDARRLDALGEECERGGPCAVDHLRLAGSRDYLLTRFYDERTADL